MDSGCVELKFNDGSMIAINCTAVENEVADNMYQRCGAHWSARRKRRAEENSKKHLPSAVCS